MCVDTCLGSAFYRGILGRCKDGLVLSLGRCKDGLVLLTREALDCVSTHV